MLNRVIAPVLALLIFAACTGPDDPIPYQTQPGYYYGPGQGFVALTVEPRVLVVEADEPVAPLVAPALRAAGLTVDSISPLYIQHWLIWVPAGTTTDAANLGARRLRLTPGVRFAATGFHHPGDLRCTLFLVNSLVVNYNASATPAVMAALNARTGMRRRPDPQGDGYPWLLSYPAGTAHSPLDIAAYYALQLGVDWAEPDMVACINRNPSAGVPRS